MSALLSLLISNWLPILTGIVISIFGGRLYLRGRRDARAKADREQHEALDRVERDVARAVAAGDHAGAGDLHEDDGFRRGGG